MYTPPCNPQSTLLYTKNVVVSIPISEIKIKKSGIGHQIFKKEKKIDLVTWGKGGGG
jgi:hypothetical protein